MPTSAAAVIIHVLRILDPDEAQTNEWCVLSAECADMTQVEVTVVTGQIWQFCKWLSTV